MSTEDYRFKIQSHIEKLNDTLYPTFKNFPKFEWYSLVSKLKDHIHYALSYCESIRQVRSKRLVRSQDLQQSIYLISSMIKTSHSQKYISTGFYRDIGLMLDYIKGMIYNLIRSISK